MYHDQALIPIKTLAFDTGVNVTLGPSIRAHIARPRNRVRHCRSRHCQPGIHDQCPAPGLAHGACAYIAWYRVSAIDNLPPLREVIHAHDLVARKSLGQNFILDLNLTAKIARAAGDLTMADVLEVGPGPGGLTRGLLAEGARKVLAVEKDHRCLPALAQIAGAYPGRLEVLNADALEAEALDRLSPPIKIVANLPYNVGTELLTRWLEPPVWPPRWQSLTLMFQREVAERIVAGPGSKAYGRLSILAGWRTRAQIVMDLPPQAFTPPPKVRSAVVHIEALAAPIYPADPTALSSLVAKAFNQRRKMLRSSLKGLSFDIENRLREAGIEPTDRAENIDIARFCALSQILKK